MKKALIKIAMPILIISFFQSPKASAENTAAAFLKIGAGAKAAAMGGVSVLSDASAIYWNPSGLADIEKTAVDITYTLLYDEAHHNFAAISKKALGGTMGLSVTYTDYGDLQGRDLNAAITNDFSAGDMAISAAYAKKIGDLSFGAALKYIHIKIGSEKGDGFAADAGLSWQTPVKNFLMNLSILNAGPKFNFSSDKKSLPLAYNLGLKYAGADKLELYAETRIRPKDKDDEFCLGAEYRAIESFLIRFGYNSKNAKLSKSADDDGLNALDNLRGLSMGFGVQMKIFDMDYAFTPFGELGNAQRITINKKF